MALLDLVRSKSIKMYLSCFNYNVCPKCISLVLINKVFQRRVDGSQDFHLFWSHYKNGFGTPNHELWFGNDKLHTLTTQKSYELRIDFVNSLGDPYYAKYSSFQINDENDGYRLILGSYSEGSAVSYTKNNISDIYHTVCFICFCDSAACCRFQNLVLGKTFRVMMCGTWQKLNVTELKFQLR